MIEALQIISIVCFVLAGISFVTAIILFIVFRIPSVIGSLTGSTARKEIEEIQQQSADTGNIGARMGREIKSRGGHTGQFTPTGSFKTNSEKLREDAAQQSGAAYAPQQGSGNGYPVGGDAYGAQEGADGTSVLNYGAEGTSVLNYGAEGTTVLNYGAEGTTVLNHAAGADPNYTQPIAGNAAGGDPNYTQPIAGNAAGADPNYTQPIAGSGAGGDPNHTQSIVGGPGETMVLNPAYGSTRQTAGAGNAGETMVLNPAYGQTGKGPGETMVLNSAYAQELLAGMQHPQQPV